MNPNEMMYRNRQYEMARSCIRAYLNDNVTFNKLSAIKKIITSDKSIFFAKDLDLSGAMLHSLHGVVISPTGTKHYEFYCIDECDELYKKVEITEWQLCVPIDILIEEYNRVLASLAL